MIKLFRLIFFMVFFIFAAAIFLSPICAVFIGFFKSQQIAQERSLSVFFEFVWNYARIIYKSGFLESFIYSLFITIFSVWLIILFSSMTSWALIRLKNKFNTFVYYCFVFSMLVPYPLLMWSSPKTASLFHLTNPFGIIVLYLGFGAGFTIFLYGTFIKQIPKEIEEAAFMDGCSVRAVFFNVTMPILTPVTMSAVIFNTVWIWNDYLMPFLIIGGRYKTIPLLIQNAAANPQAQAYFAPILILSLFMPVLFFISFRKNIIKSFSAGIHKN